MIKYYNWDVVMAEVPDEITLAINISNCPHRCKGCHTPQLQNNVGTELTTEILNNLINKNKGITCIAFMGGDADVISLNQLASYINKESHSNYKIAWYSGNDSVNPDIDLSQFDYIKIGHYSEMRGPLNKVTTNQRFYRVIMTDGINDAGLPNYSLEDITSRFWNK